MRTKTVKNKLNKINIRHVTQLGLKTALSWLSHLMHASQTQNIQLSTCNN